MSILTFRRPAVSASHVGNRPPDTVKFKLNAFVKAVVYFTVFVMALFEPVKLLGMAPHPYEHSDNRDSEGDKSFEHT